MYIRHLDIYTNQKTQVFPLSMLKDIRLGIDGNVWLKRVLQSASEQYYSGIGGTPSGLRKAIEKELESFKSASIHPLFVFSGLTLIRKEKPHVSDEGKTTKRNAAWESVNAGKMDVALSYWNQSHAIHQPDLIHLVMRILKEHGIDYIRAPYDAGAQLVYLEHNPKQIIHATYAGPELLMFDIERVITSIDFSKQSFSAVSKKTVLQDLMLTDDQFLDLCILAGGDQCSTFPSFVQSAFAPASVERLLQHRTGFNLIKSNANDQQLSKYVDVYFRVRCAVRHHPVLTDDGHVEPMNADQAPNDIHEFIGYCLPNEVYYYISRGLISDAALNALLCRYGAEFSPLCNGETKEYRNFLSGDIMKIKAQTITLIQSQLNTFYNDRKVSIIHWYDNSASTAQEHVVKPELAPVKVSDISNWKSGKQSVEKELKKAGITAPTYSFALGLVANPSDAAVTVLAKDAEKPAPLGTLAEVQTRHISKLLQLRSFIETSHVPSPYGKAILNAYKAHSTAPPEFQDALFIALELVKSELLTSRPYNISYNKKPVLEDEAATKAVRLVSRTVSLIGARFKGTKSWAGPLNRDLLVFNSVNKVLTRNLRHLSEALILQMLLNNECQREELDFTDLATQLPFAYEPSTILGILVKEYLETLALNSNSSSGSNNKEQALKQVEENIGATSASSLSDTIKEEVQRGFAFWDLVFDAVKSLGSAISKELLQEFQDANDWIKSRKV